MIKKISGIIIILTFVFWVIWDIYAYIYGNEATLSVVITDFAYYSPMGPLIFGILMGHWFWPAKGTGE